MPGYVSGGRNSDMPLHSYSGIRATTISRPTLSTSTWAMGTSVFVAGSLDYRSNSSNPTFHPLSKAASRRSNNAAPALSGPPVPNLIEATSNRMAVPSLVRVVDLV
jgi:hypothetical protein